MTTSTKDDSTGPKYNPELYNKARPAYPSELNVFLASNTAAHDLVWDVATGTGQAAFNLAAHYKRVIATDLSEDQIGKAPQACNITYLPLPAELTEQQCAAHPEFFSPGSIDLITVAQGVHWFNLDAFYDVVKKVIKPHTGVIAVWTYSFPCIDDEVNDVVASFYREVTGEPFSKNLAYVVDVYETLPFPFTELEVPMPRAFSLTGNADYKQFVACESIDDLRKFSSHPNMNYLGPKDQSTEPNFLTHKKWCLTDLVNYVESWSIVRLASQRLQRDVMEDFRKQVAPAWKNAVKRRFADIEADSLESVELDVLFPIYMKCGRFCPQ